MSSTMFDVMQLNEEHDRGLFYSGSESLSPFTLFLPLIAVDKKGKK
ncbi:hypothetical protein SAMN02982990_01397 [Photorhabdus luminescens]|uniref:Uncharacterized protein n=1 Tax=Photorhabdus luminescens TaxID=29488 RepID=A0A1G5QAM9_PHOLU|nr:hypothetical protein SAMN02982990_01397 [Photorhabdus luminescens]